MKLLALLLSAVPAYAAFTWGNVRIGGGGGFVPGIVFHPKEKGLAYARTDIGGIYRLNSDDSWTAITDSVADHANWNRWGVDALALDPQNADVVYAAAGMYTNSWDPNNGSIMKSTNRGASWTFSTLPFKIGGNMPGRGMGERLAVDPKNSNVVYFGARSGNGLWKSTDAGKTFNKVSSFTAAGTYIPDPSDSNGYNNDKQGLAFVTFDSNSATVGGATSRIFVGTADNITASVYVSEDAGSTWKAVSGQPGRYFPHKCKLQPQENALYLTYADGSGPYDGISGAVWRYDIAGSKWTDITPVTGGDLYYGFGGLGVDLQKPGTLVVASLNSWYPDAQIFRSTDSGATWSPLWAWSSWPDMTKYYGMDVSKAPWIRTDFLNVDTKWLGWMIESLEINPLDSNHWLYGTGLTIFGGHDLTKWDTTHNVSIQSLADGIEEYSVQDVKSAPKGSELLAAVGDESGFTFRDTASLSKAPQKAWDNPMWTTSSSSDYAGNKVDNVVRVGSPSGKEMVAVSTDGGQSWNINYATDTTKSGGQVAYSADADTIVWSTSANGVVRSQYQGSFATVSSLPASAIIASDKRNNNYFYAASGSTFYVSSNIGSSFSKGGAVGSATSIRDVFAHPAIAGEVYVSTDVGVFRSTNFGSTFTQLGSGISNTYRISLGVGSSGWNIYVFGTGSAGSRLYGSADSGATWTDIQGSSQGFGAIDSCRIAGSGNVANKIYVGTNGRGILSGQGTLPGGGSSGPTSTSTTTTSRSTTLSTSTTSRSSTTTTSTSTAPPPTNTAVAPAYGQCGGSGWTGPVTCPAGWTCKYQNDWYSQCLQ